MKKTFLILFLVVSSFILYAQNNHSVDLVTGRLNVNIPIFAVQSGGVGVSGDLNYTGSGVRVTDDDGWLGHGWSLSVEQYRIAREMRGLPDDHYGTGSDTRRGWLHGTMGTIIKNFVVSDDNNPATCTDEVANYNMVGDFGMYKDTEPDVYYVNAPGISFQFYFDEIQQPRVVPYTDVSITRTMENNKIKSFTVTNDNGVKYEFTEIETISESMNSTSLYYFVRKTNQHYQLFTYTTSWRLTKILSPVYGTVDFTYRTISVNDDDLISIVRDRRGIQKYRYPLIASNSWQAGGTLKYFRASTLKVPDKIISTTSEVHFISAPKFSGNVLERLNSIKVFDKRTSPQQLTREFLFNYSIYGTDKRAFLSSVKEKTVTNELVHGFGYNMPNILPVYSSSNVDDWEYFKIKNPVSTDYQYDETASAGVLRQIKYPTKGYTVFFYETNQYQKGFDNTQGGGIRIKKIISYDGVSSDHDQIQEFEYKLENGSSSGRLTYEAKKEFNVVRQPQLHVNSSMRTAPRYREIQVLTPAVSTENLTNMFKISGDKDMGNQQLLLGSYVAYSRITVKTKGAGYSVYEYEVPALEGDHTANNNEWQRSKVLIARQSTGNAYCFEKPNIEGGFDHYPFPVNPNYEFARGLLKKVTDFREDGVKVRDVVYDYQRVYGGTGIRKIYGLALEELPTYYYNGSSYVDGKMFLFSKYEINTEVKTALTKLTETVYHSTDLTKKTETLTDYYYSSPNHRYLSRVESFNSDGTKSITRYKYVKDYNITSPAGTEATAVANLRTARRFAGIVESTSSKVVNGVERYLESGLTTFQTISGKVYPFKIYSFTSANGLTNFTATSSTSSSFAFDQTNYVLGNTYLSFDSYGNATEVIGRNREVTAVVYGYEGTLPILEVSHARLGEMKYANFDANGVSLSDSFYPTWSYTTCPGRNGSVGINVPAGSASTKYFTGGVLANRLAEFTIFSFWAKAVANATVYLRIGSYTFPIAVTASSDWKYYTIKNPIESLLGFPSSYAYTIWSSAPVQLDDMAFYPETVDFVSNTYKIPFGKTAMTDSRGNASSFEYDDMGRLKVVYDRDKNVIKTYDYRVKPY